MESTRTIEIRKNGSSTGGKKISVKEEFSLEDLLHEAKSTVGVVGMKLFSSDGKTVDDVASLRDGDIVYVSEGEDFISKKQCHSASDLAQVTRKRLSLHQGSNSSWVTLNVGGKLFTTTRSTLTTQEPDSMLARMFADEGDSSWLSSVDSNGAYLIDRSPAYFDPILNYLRHGQLVIDKFINPLGVLEEAQFFGLTSLVGQLEALIEKEEQPTEDSPITRREFILSLMTTPSNCELRCQGMNFTGANLSKLDLRYINFKHANLKKTDFSGANVSYCNFERADLTSAIFDGAQLLGAKFPCAHMEGASMKGCNFEDPAGSRANMESANMKNVNLEGSHMAGVNLRVATLKNSNLQNCDLRGAVLAGADLENCDLNGCDLQEANLRGANLKGASLELMLNPLHMSQTVR